MTSFVKADERMNKFLQIDEKWSVRYNPAMNDRPEWWHRNGVEHSPWIENNACTAMFYALLEKSNDISS